MTTNPDYLGDVLAELGIAFYPRLAEPLMDTRLNAGAPARQLDWTAEESTAFAAICGGVEARLGYHGIGSRPLPAVPKRARRPERRRIVLRSETL